VLPIVCVIERLVNTGQKTGKQGAPGQRGRKEVEEMSTTTTAFSEATQRQPKRPFFAYWSPERAVLSHLLDQHPRRLTFQELAREAGCGFKESALERAVGNLAAANLLHWEGAALVPAPAVVSFDQGAISTEF
jgi:hypothetical protein